MTDRENRLYQKSYGRNRHAPDYTRCCELVMGPERYFNSHQCRRKRGHGPDEAYCKQHDPAVVAARREKQEARWKAEFNRDRIQWNGKVFLEALQQIADGHNDPRGLAQEVIAKFKEGER